MEDRGSLEASGGASAGREDQYTLQGPSKAQELEVPSASDGIGDTQG